MRSPESILSELDEWREHLKDVLALSDLRTEAVFHPYDAIVQMESPLLRMVARIEHRIHVLSDETDSLEATNGTGS